MTVASLAVCVQGVGLLGPGLASWREAIEVFSARRTYVATPTVLPVPQRLPAAERRRAGAAIRLVMAVADEAVMHSGVDPRQLASVFTSSSGEGANCHALCETLSSTDRSVSPTRFTNSVHNAAAGYWHIAVASRAASTSLCGFDGGFGAGLLEAVAQVAVTRQPVLLVAADTPYPEPLHSVRPLADHFGTALVLSPVPDETTLATLHLALGTGPRESTSTACRRASLEALRASIPAAAGLPLLEALVAPVRKQQLVIACPPALQLQIEVEKP